MNLLRTKAGWVIALGAAIPRLLCAWFSLGADHPNETYRLLEPLAAMRGYSTRLPWEWTDGLLSTLPVRVHLAVLDFAHAFGITSALAELEFLKLGYALLSLLPLLATWRLLAPRSRTLAAFATGLLALWPEFIFRSVRLMDYSLEAALLALGVIFLFTFPRRPRPSAFAAGVALGLAFFVRPQSGLYLLALLAGTALDAGTPRLARAAALGTGYALTVITLGAWETHLTHAGFLAPFWNYLHFNWTENGAARLYGVAPWHRYLSEAAKAFGVSGFLALVALAGLGWRGGKTDRRLAILFVFPVAVLSLLGHKEGRFVFGGLWVLVPLAWSGVAAVDAGLREVPRPRWRTLLIAALALGFAVNAERVSRRLPEGNRDVREWSAIGERLASAPEGAGPLRIEADPDFVPGAFFLRYAGGLCYAVGTSAAADPRCAKPPFATLRRLNEAWDLGR